MKLINILFLLSTFVHFRHCFGQREKKGYNVTHYIIGGSLTDDQDVAKYIVSIQSSTPAPFGWSHFCAGTIIGVRKILSAAHCFQAMTPEDIIVVIGLRHRFKRTDATRVMRVDLIVSHPYYDDVTKKNDVAVVILAQRIAFSSSEVAMAELPTNPVYPDQECTVLGWGRIFQAGPLNSDLAFADMKTTSFVKCKNKYKRLFKDGMLCVAESDQWDNDACKGDSGGPLIYQTKVIGIVSWGFECRFRSYPAVFTDVYYYKSWIVRNGKSRTQPLALTFILMTTTIFVKGYFVYTKLLVSKII